MVLAFIRCPTKLLSFHSHFIRSSEIALTLKYRQLSNHTSNFNMEKMIAIGQMRATNDKIANRQQVQQIVEYAAKENACVCILNIINESKPF